MSMLLVYRYIDYSATKSQLYMMDYCYFVNLSVALQVLLYPNNLQWFQANYVMCLGPICVAIVVWHNSLVFHSLDKVTSFFLHAFPPIVMHLHRCKFIKNDLPLDNESFLPLYSNFVLPLWFYIIWQVTYLFATEVLLQSHLKDKTVVISLRYLVTDKKNPTINLIKKFLLKQGVMKKDEELDPDSMLAKIIFVVCQATYTLFAILHVRLIYSSYYIAVAYMMTIFGIGVWNGASYYIEIFSKRYNLKFKTKSNDELDASNKSNENGQVYSCEENFVDVLGNLDLNKPQNLEIYTSALGSIVTEAQNQSNSVAD